MKKNDFLLSAPRAVRLMLMVLMCLPMWGGSVLMAQTSEPYAVFDEASGVLTFKYDNKKPGGAYSLNNQESTTPWKDVKGKIKKVVFNSSFANARPTKCTSWFSYCSNLTGIEGLEYLNTSEVTNMSGMFIRCYKLTTLDLSTFNTSKVTDMSYMFHECLNLTTLDVSKFNTSKVTRMDGMFQLCQSLSSLDVSNFNTANVENMNCMFSECSNLIALDVSGFNTAKVKDMGAMFNSCRYVSTLDVSKFNTAKVENMADMFANMQSVTKLDVSNFNTANVINMGRMFRACEAITSLDVSGFNTSKVTIMFEMFCGSSRLTALDCSNFDTGNVTNMESMFSYCSALTTLDLSSFDNKNVETMGNMFSYCKNLTSLNLTDFNTSNVTNMEQMFFQCNKLASLDLSCFNTANVKNMARMFLACSELVSLDLSNFNTANVRDMTAMFFGCSKLVSLDISSFNTMNLTNMSNMFKGCSSIVSLDLSSFNTLKVNNMEKLFFECSKLATIYASDKFVTTSVTNDSQMFTSCTSLKGAIPFYHGQNSSAYANFDGYFTPAMFAVLDKTNKVITFKRNKEKPAGAYSVNDCLTFPKWLPERDNIKKVVFDESFAAASPRRCHGWFSTCQNLTEIEGLDRLNTTEVTDMSYMFQGCKGFTTLDLSGFNTTKVETMDNMFNGCSNLATIYAEDTFVTTAVTDGADMFLDCTSLKGAIAYDASKTDHRYANYINGYFKSKNPSGISGMTFSGNEKTECFDLLGRRTGKLQKGINIVRRGNKTVKVLDNVK